MMLVCYKVVVTDEERQPVADARVQGWAILHKLGPMVPS